MIFAYIKTAVAGIKVGFWVLLAAAVVTLCVLAQRGCVLQKQLRFTENSLGAAMEAKDSSDTRVVTLTRELAEQNEVIQAAAERLQVSERRITQLQQVKGYTRTEYRERIIRDTTYLAGMVDSVAISNTVPIRAGCLSGTITWTGNSDTAFIDVNNLIDLEITGYRKRQKNWFWRFRWGAGGWDTYVNVFNRCDSGFVIENNTLILIK